MPRVVPDRINKLEELAYNLWWSWNPPVRAVFRELDYPLWRLGGHNPVKLLREISQDRLEEAARDNAFLSIYDAAVAAFDASMEGKDHWFPATHPGGLPGPVAFFSMEFAIHNSLPIYAGGLGILAGDLSKEACDLGIPFVGVGFMYPQGYFHQHISEEGWQEEQYSHLNFDETPITQVFSPSGGASLTQVQLGERSVHLGLWRVKVGCINLYLLDTNIKENDPQDRQLSARLYIADRERRVEQEILLGIGGVRVLRTIGYKPALWHANEGHTSFMMLERVRELVTNGMRFDEAASAVRAATVFTTHTPVPAGNEVFPAELVERYFSSYWDSLGIDRQTFLGLGRVEGGNDPSFNMTALGLRMADHRNGVSLLHGKVSRKMWHGLWPDIPADQVPITHITNGVHLPTWIAPEMCDLLSKYCGPDWIGKHDNPEVWARVAEIPDEELWALRMLLKRNLIHMILERAQDRWAEGEALPKQILGIGALLDQEVLTIGFVRRFAEYKRPALILSDIARIKRIVTDRFRPVQIVFAGKSHPADFTSKNLLHKVYTLAVDREFLGRVAFVEDYDMHVGRELVRGVDIWLNNPRRWQEASGTSGMKAAMNGGLHLSVLDGWWHEGYNGSNGWAIGPDVNNYDPANEDAIDADSLYRLLEEQIVPLYYNRDRKGVPHGWVGMMKEAIRSIAPLFCTRRMLKQYVEQMYLPAARTLVASQKI